MKCWDNSAHDSANARESNGKNVHCAGSDGGPGHEASVAARVVGDAIGPVIGKHRRSVSVGIGQIGVCFFGDGDHCVSTSFADAQKPWRAQGARFRATMWVGNWFFGDSPLESHECKEQEERQAPPPPRGGGRGHEWKADAWQKTSGWGRDGGSTAVGRRTNHDFPPATNASIPLRMDHAKACIDSHPQYSPRRPFLPLRALNPYAIFLRVAPPSVIPEEPGNCWEATEKLKPL